MEEFNIIPITKEYLYEMSGMLPDEVSRALWNELPVTALAVKKGSTVVGALSGAANGGYFDISSIHVAEAYRRQGAGTALMRRLFSLLDGEDLLPRVMYGKSSLREPSFGEADVLMAFLLSLGFERGEVALPPYFVEPLQNFVEDADGDGKGFPGIAPFSKTEEALLEELAEDVKEGGWPRPAWSLLSDTVDKGLSLCRVQDGRVVSYVAVDLGAGEPIEISAVWHSEEEGEAVKEMLSTVIADLKKVYHPDTKIIMLAMGNGEWEVTRTVCPDGKPATICYVCPDYEELFG